MVVKTVLGSHFGVGAPLILVYVSGDWDVHWGYDLAFDVDQPKVCEDPELPQARTSIDQAKDQQNRITGRLSEGEMSNPGLMRGGCA